MCTYTTCIGFVESALVQAWYRYRYLILVSVPIPDAGFGIGASQIKSPISGFWAFFTLNTFSQSYRRTWIFLSFFFFFSLSTYPSITSPLFLFFIGLESLSLSLHPALHLHKNRPEPSFFQCCSAAWVAETQGPQRFWGISTPTLCPRPSQECLLSVGLGHGQTCGLPVSPRRGRESERTAALCQAFLFSPRRTKGCVLFPFWQNKSRLPQRSHAASCFAQVVTTTLLVRLPRRLPRSPFDEYKYSF